ncbi:unnamed protein product [Sphagnum balticum]
MNCRMMRRFGGVYNYEDYIDRGYKTSDQPDPVTGYDAKAGDAVLVGQFNGQGREGVIIGGLTHAARKTTIQADDGPQYDSEFNGIRTEINADGEWTLTFRGQPTNLDGLDNTPSARIPAAVYDTKVGTTFMKLDITGSWTINDNANSDPQFIKIDKPGGILTVQAGQVSLVMAKGAQSAVLTCKDTTINSSNSITENTTAYQLKASATAKIDSPKVAIGHDAIELLDQLTQLIDALGKILPISPVGPCTMLNTVADWPVVEQIKGKINQIKVNVIPTLYGTVEEHSDVRYYDIVIEGTTGMAPKFVKPGFSGSVVSPDDATDVTYAALQQSGRAAYPISNVGALGGFFSNTISQISNILNSAGKAVSAITGQANQPIETVQSINLTTQEQTIVTNATTAVSQYSRNDFVNLQQEITSYRDAQADILGLTDATYNSTFNRNAITAQTKAQVQDIEYLETLQASLQTIDFILANLFAVDAAVDPFALARANANNPAVNIGQYASGRLVRFEYGDDLESLATRYLGDPNRWVDIALANGLQPPYIDEIGQTIPLESNGSGNKINIAATDAQGNDNSEKFYVNQTIFLQSSTLPFPDQRNISSIDVVQSNGDLVITLTGPSNLSQYTTAANANVLVYAPDTVNSNLFILIPSPDPLPNNRQDTVPWFLAQSQEDERRMGIDLLLGTNDDLVFTPNHDLSLSYSLQNASQAMKLKIVTELGELRYHQGFGLVNVIGNKNNNLSTVKAAITSSLLNQVSQDSRFDRIESLNVSYLAGGNSPSMIVIEMTVRLAGGSQVIPISFSVNYT